MVNKQLNKKERHDELQKFLHKAPFSTDLELAEHFLVSVQTIRLDRLELGIPQVRERVKAVAENAYSQLRSLEAQEVVGELLDIRLNEGGISLMDITEEMILKSKKVVRGHYLFAQANSLAVAVIDAPAVLTGSARIRYKKPVFLGDRVVAKAVVKVQKTNTYLISVYSTVDNELVFKGQFIVTIPK
ncbi:MAG: transcription factor FapR [Bacillota bacterium]